MLQTSKSLLLKLLLTLFLVSISAWPSSRRVIAQIPVEATLVESLGGETTAVFVDKQTVWLKPTDQGLQDKELRIPRLCSPVRSIVWVAATGKIDTSSPLELKPEPTYWLVSFQDSPSPGAVVRIELDETATTLDQLKPIQPAADGSILLHAHQATTHGEKLRFEPQSFKNTVGYWTVPTDHATWTISVDRPGTYAAALLMGCGTGQGGSDGKLTLTREDVVIADLAFTVPETGHFQNFRWLQLGNIRLDQAGDYALKVAPTRIANAALGDIRMIHLIRQAVPQR